MLLESLHLKNFLSFGPDAEPIILRPLNVLIGINGSGKSNFLEAISLLQAAPDQLTRPIRDGGGVSDWLWKDSGGVRSSAKATATVDAVIRFPNGPTSLRHVIDFTESGGRFSLEDEKVENASVLRNSPNVFFFYHYNQGQPVLSVQKQQRRLLREDVEDNLSILAQRRDPEQYPEITYLANQLRKIKLYREWSFGRYSSPRLPQRTDGPCDFLEPDGSNLGVVLNNFDLSSKRRLLQALQALFEGINSYHVGLIEGNAQVFLEEQDRRIPATRLSDGTLRYLSLLAVLCHPSPPPLVCIEEPELGLHPDVLPTLAKLLCEASERTQLVVTTHSPVLVDALSETPESVLVCERNETGTSLVRLEQEELEPWLEKYRLGQLWTRGDLGGTRW